MQTISKYSEYMYSAWSLTQTKSIL